MFVQPGEERGHGIVDGGDLPVEIRRIILTDIQSIPGVIETMPCVIADNQAFNHVKQEVSPQKVK